MNVQSTLDQAVRLAEEAAAIAAEGFTASPEVELKPDGSPVTAYDIRVEDHLRARLAAAFPGDGVLGEERAATPGTSGRRWIIDPIGGTADFVRRIPLFSVDIAMEDGAGPAIAVSAMPVSRLIMAAGRGLGAHVLRDGEPVSAATRVRVDDGHRELAGAVVCAHGLKSWPLELLTALHTNCALRDGVHSVHRLITGHAHAVVLAAPGAMGYDDLACLPVLVEEAGGRVTDLSGGPVLDGDGTVLATNGVLHDRFLELITAAGAGPGPRR